MSASTAPDGSLPRWQRSLLPAMLGADRADRDDARGTLPRSARDWLVDVGMFCFSVLAGIGLTAAAWRYSALTVHWIGIALGIPSCLALWWRRRYPFLIGVTTACASAASPLAAVAALMALFTVAIYCVPRRTGEVTALSLAACVVFPFLYPGSNGYDRAPLIFGIAMTIIAVACGLFVRARRELVLSLHERNRELRDEQHRRVVEAQQAERTRIAREMHDVLAHRISLLSVHAGALEFRPDAPPQEIARAAQVIRVSARAAQEELREVIGVLRTESETEAVEPPQPTLSDLSMLVAESRGAGMDVRLDTALEAEALPPMLGRTVYRIVQEGLTNARKHAPGQLVTISVAGHRAAGVSVTVANRPAVGHELAEGDRRHVGSGTGLVGIEERVALAGGRLTRGRLPGGGFQLCATLPWPREARR